ncbi:sulfite exporter TauE/SafE family protein [Lysobacter sp. GX 14042]|uniref:sulfite exporter TauE/SafE family protein n=1 Tax=Lysobacter sp. GX 14042 TaxID=2907155 RepID=UPI001F3DA7AA|nr:sulfite exporter TauE/SafE family protein [Lysobacter sp. GX 14042]MCE7031428.1 sulfite exporter TauE/SafE family protein [Lysobacter sp. GX 14042]
MLLEVLVVLFIATFIRSAFGFGEALVAVPLLALIVPVEVAAPVAVLVSITVSVVSVAQDWRHIHMRSAGWLFASTLFGVPFGLWLLSAAPTGTVKTALAVVIIVFSAYLLLNRYSVKLESDRFAPLFGFLAGILGGAYGMNGPPLVAYGTLRRWSPQHFRATLQGYFLPASAVVMAGYWMAGLWTPEVTNYYLLSLPVVVAAILAGRMANRHFNEHVFLVCVHCGLIVVGAALLWQAYA